MSYTVVGSENILQTDSTHSQGSDSSVFTCDDWWPGHWESQQS